MKLKEFFRPSCHKLSKARKRFNSTVLEMLPRSGVSINMGSLDTKFHGFYNLDICIDSKADIVADLRCSFPFLDGSISYVRASHVFEHLPDIIATINECWRVLKPNAVLEIIVPHTEGIGAFQDPTHCSFWNRGTVDYFRKDSETHKRMKIPYGIKSEFDLLEMYQDNISLFMLLKVVK